MRPLKQIIIHLIHLLVTDHPVLGMDHLLLPTITHLPLLLFLLPPHIPTRDIVIFQLDLHLQTIMDHHHPRHLTLPQAMGTPLLLITPRQVVVGTIPIQLLLLVTEVLRLRVPLLAMEHHPQIPLTVTINPHLLHIILILHTTLP